MKKYLLLFTAILISILTYSQTTTALGGSWENSTSWDNGVPSCGTHTNIVIPNNVIIEIKNTTIDLSSCDVQIVINGTLDFDRRGNTNVSELSLGSNSSITIQSGGMLAYSNKTNQYNTIKVLIGGIEVWDGSDGDITTDGIINAASNNGSQTPLPVELAYFKVEENNNKLLFKWKTYSEINNDYFIIEKLENGKTITVGYLMGYGTTNTEKYYEYVTDLLEGYFRLTQVDFDGKTKSYDYVSFFLRQSNENTEVRYFNLNGKEISNLQRGLNIIIIDNKAYKLFR